MVRSSAAVDRGEQIGGDEFDDCSHAQAAHVDVLDDHVVGTDTFEFFLLKSPTQRGRVDLHLDVHCAVACRRCELTESSGDVDVDTVLTSRNVDSLA